MKRYITVFLAILITMCFGITSFANNNEIAYSFSFDGFDITVSGVLSENEAYNIAYAIYCDEMGIAIPVICSPCDISGHYYKYSITTSTSHRVYSSVTKCKLNTYNAFKGATCLSNRIINF